MWETHSLRRVAGEVQAARPTGIRPGQEDGMTEKRAGYRAKARPAIVPADARRSEWEQNLEILMREAGLPEPTPQAPLGRAIGRRWTVDFWWPEYVLAVEVEGGIWGDGTGARCRSCGRAYGGSHGRPQAIERDIEKHNALTLQGAILLRVTEKTISSGDAVDLIAAALRRQGWDGPERKQDGQ